MPGADDAAVSDAGAVDAFMSDAFTSDADMPDAGNPGPAPGTAQELVSGGGTVSGGGLVMDVQLGHAHSQQSASAGATTLEGNTAIKP